MKKLGRFKRPGHRVLRRGPGTHTNRGIGWEFVHVAIDDTSRLAYLEILPNEKGVTCVAFLERAIAWFAQHGVTVERVMTDNGTGYRSETHTIVAFKFRQSPPHNGVCRVHGWADAPFERRLSCSRSSACVSVIARHLLYMNAGIRRSAEHA